MVSDNNPALLVALRQLFPDQAREIWVLVHGARSLIDAEYGLTAVSLTRHCVDIASEGHSSPVGRHVLSGL